MKKLNKWVVDLFGKMKLYGISQRELAKKMEVSEQWVSDVMNGKRESAASETAFNIALEEIISERT